MSSKEDILAKIDKLAKRFKGYRISAENMDTYDIAFKFFEDMEKIYKDNGDADYFNYEFDKACIALERRFQTVDEFVDIEILWEEFDVDISSAQDLKVAGITVKWSDDYIFVNPRIESSLTIKIEDMFLLGE